MVFEQPFDRFLIFGAIGFFQVDHFRIALSFELAVVVVDVGNPAGHSRGEVSAGLAEDHHAPAGHVLAAVVADAFDDRVHAAVADAESLADDAAQVDLAGDRAVADDVAGDDVFFGFEGRSLRWVRDDAPAGEALTEIVVGVAFELEALEQEDVDTVRELVEAHLHFTGSKLAAVVLDHWELHLPQFVKVMPRDYKRALGELAAVTVSSGGDGFLTTESEERA